MFIYLLPKMSFTRESTKSLIVPYPFIRIQGEISTVLYKDQIKYLKTEGAWPKEFEESDTPADKLNQLSVKVKYTNLVVSCLMDITFLGFYTRLSFSLIK